MKVENVPCPYETARLPRHSGESIYRTKTPFGDLKSFITEGGQISFSGLACPWGKLSLPEETQGVVKYTHLQERCFDLSAGALREVRCHWEHLADGEVFGSIADGSLKFWNEADGLHYRLTPTKEKLERILLLQGVGRITGVSVGYSYLPSRDAVEGLDGGVKVISVRNATLTELSFCQRPAYPETTVRVCRDLGGPANPERPPSRDCTPEENLAFLRSISEDEVHLLPSEEITAWFDQNRLADLREEQFNECLGQYRLLALARTIRDHDPPLSPAHRLSSEEFIELYRFIDEELLAHGPAVCLKVLAHREDSEAALAATRKAAGLPPTRPVRWQDLDGSRLSLTCIGYGWNLIRPRAQKLWFDGDVGRYEGVLYRNFRAQDRQKG